MSREENLMPTPGGSPMAFCPAEAPVYGGAVLQVNLGNRYGEGGAEPKVSEEDDLYLVLEGRQQTHVVTLKHTGDWTWLAPIPGHNCAERVRLSVISYSSQDIYDCVLSGEFIFQYDSAYFIAQFLINSVNNPSALDDLELIKSEEFDLANELLSTLDERLCAALKHIQFPEGWHMLGSEPYEDDEPDCRETLLHFASRLGLHDTAVFLLGKAGSEDALCVINREGQLPCAVAAHSGFEDIAELFSGYNTHGMVTQVDQDLDTDFGIIRSHGNSGISLTTLPEAAQNRQIETLIAALREMEATMKRGRSPGLRRQYQTDWPSPPLPPRNPHHGQGPSYTQESSTEAQVAQTMERILEEQRAHSSTLSHMMQEYGPFNNGASSGGDSGGRSSPYSGLHISSEVMMEASRQYGILEGSLTSVRGISEGLQRLRGTTLLQRRIADQQHVRRVGLSRFSTSCPSLDAQSKPCPLSPIHEGDQHKSMLDLAKEVGCSPLAGQSPAVTLNDGFIAPPDPDNEGTVRICVNGVTVDSTEDFPRDGLDGDDGVVRRRRPPGQLLTSAEDDVRRRSWCPDSPRMYGGSHGQEVMDSLQNRSLAMAGKSQSLSGLDCEDGSDDDALHQPTSPSRRQVTQRQAGLMMLSHDADSLEAAEDRALSAGSHSPEDDRSFSPVDSDGSGSAGAAKDGPDGPEVMRQLSSEMMTSSPQAAHSMSDLSTTQGVIASKEHARSMAGLQGARSYEDERGMLGVGHSPITKSLSTPSIPAATQGKAGDERRHGPRDLRRDGKQPSEPSQVLIQKFVEEYDAKFRRQDEIEEEEEDGSTTDRKEMTWKDFLNEEPGGGGDSDEKSKHGGHSKEEKKRKPSVFSRIQNSYRTKKHKDKESKVKHSHHFVAVSFSNATPCNVCHKPMANKPALRCENCLINVHEHNCKDQVALCDKYSNMKVLQREGSAPAAMMQDRQTAGLQGSSLRPSNSFKLKDRSASAPDKRETSGTMAFVPHRHSVPSGPGKAISETDETDSTSLGHDTGPSNITDSLESLDAAETADSLVVEEDADLMLGVEEPEAWNVTVDRKTLKKMNAKDIKRQDTIWELIQTEKQYVKRLKIMQKLFRDLLLSELGMSLEFTDRLFPGLDELYELHAAFLRSLLALQTVNTDRSVDDIGPTLLKQFSEGTAERMKSVYGVFCSKHTEAIQLYKDTVKTEKKFQNFCKKISLMSICEKRELPDFILGVTVRLAKYPILIEAIFKSTKDKRDREQLSNALRHSKVVVHGVDEQVAAYEKLMEVYRAFDSRTTVYMGRKFKRQDLITGRHLLHAGSIGWKNARSRVLDTYALVLTDLMVFLQKNEQKYTFFIQDNKSCVVPLYKLLVREKRDERDSHGIYVISQNPNQPEMYELVCRTRDERDQWMSILLEAIKNCPEPEEVQQQQQQQPQPEVVTEEERRRQEEKARKLKDIINQLHQKDDGIRGLCEEKNQLMLDLLEISATEQGASRPNSQYDNGSSTSVEVVQAAIQEASRLTTILQGSGTQLSRSVSSVGEHVSPSYVNMLMPKRAETFAGFDTPFDNPKTGALVKKRFTQQYGDEEGRCPSELSLGGTDTIPEDSVISTDSRFSSQPGLSPQSLPSSSSSLPRGSPQAWDSPSPGEGEGAGVDTSDHGSMGELSAASVSSLVQPLAQPASAEQMMSVVQLVKYLHNLMNLTAKQTTTVECLRAELAEAKEEISKLSQDMHGQRRSVYGHNQLEELRNLQENISRERQVWEEEKEREQEALRQERVRLEADRKTLERQEQHLRSKEENLRREKETLQRQIDMMREQGMLVTSTLADSEHVVQTLDLDTLPAEPHQESPDRTVPGHRRSASADFYHGVPPSLAEQDLLSEVRGMPRRPRHSVSSLQNFNAQREKQNIPEHLMSTRNEQRVGGANMQKLPMKLAGAASGNHHHHPHKPQTQQVHPSSGNHHHHPQKPQPQQVHPRTSSMSSLGAKHGGSSPSPVTPTPQQAQGMITRNQNSRSAPSNLAMIKKLAEPSGKSRAGSSGPAPSKAGSSQAAPGGPGSAPGAPEPPAEGSPDRVIYF